MAELNTEPRFIREPDIQGTTVIGPSANTNLDGTGSNITSIFQADATNGGFVQKIRIVPTVNFSYTTICFFINTTTGTFTPGTSNTSSNTFFIKEITILHPSTSQTEAFTFKARIGNNYQYFPLIFAEGYCDIEMNLSLPPGYRILASFTDSTGSAGQGVKLTTIGGKY